VINTVALYEVDKGIEVQVLVVLLMDHFDLELAIKGLLNGL